jgi:hypothetical protein
MLFYNDEGFGRYEKIGDEIMVFVHVFEHLNFGVKSGVEIKLVFV